MYNCHSQTDDKLVFDGNILQYFRPSLSYHLSLRSLFNLFLSGRLPHVLLCSLARSPARPPARPLARSIARSLTHSLTPLITYLHIGYFCTKEMTTYHLTNGLLINLYKIGFVLFDLILYAPSTIFLLSRNRSSWVEPVLS